MPRRVRVVLCGAGGEVLGELPELVVEPQWWPEVGPIVAAVRDELGTEISVLRLLDTEGANPDMGGSVSYLAELLGDAPPEVMRPTTYGAEVSADHPLRAHWARPGGVAATVHWADEVLTGQGRARIGPVVQQKSWNLSCLLRLPVSGGDVWCKSVPPFFAHEGPVLRLVAAGAPDLVPEVLGHHPGGTTLIAHVPGDDQWEAPVERLLEMVQLLVDLQVAWAGRTDELLEVGGWDWRRTRLPALVDDLVRQPQVRSRMTVQELAAVDALVGELPVLLDALERCGLPETLVHGDCHPGNWRWGPAGLVLLDWGDSGVGHPMLDFAACLPRLPDAVRPVVRAAWVEAWRDGWPGCDPARAAELIDRLAALRQAVLYQCFLGAIEPSERVYHADDPVTWLRNAIRARARGPGPLT